MLCSVLLIFSHVAAKAASKLVPIYLVGISLCSLCATSFTPSAGYNRYVNISSKYARRKNLDILECHYQDDISLVRDFEENEAEATSSCCIDRDSVLSLLQSPAPESLHVIETFASTLNERRDSIQWLETLLDAKHLSKTLVKPGFQIELTQNKLVNDTNNLRWTVVPMRDDKDGISSRKIATVKQQRLSLSTLELAHDALNLAVEASLKNELLDQQTKNLIVVEAKVSDRSKRFVL